jgi:hypothetical protein
MFDVVKTNKHLRKKKRKKAKRKRVLCLKGNADDTQFAQPLRGEKKKTT